VKAVYENQTLVSGNELACRWEAANHARAMELNDMLDPLTIQQRRALCETFTEDEQNGLVPEYIRRRNNEEAPVGSLVKPNKWYGFAIWARIPGGHLHTIHNGLALVVGAPEHGTSLRYVYLLPPRENGGDRVVFAETRSYDLTVVGNASKELVDEIQMVPA
jgi:hypothetical protein